MLKFYIISTAIVLAVVIITIVSMMVELKREGHKPKSNQSTLVELIRVLMPYLLPFLNIVLALILIFSYDTIKERLAKKYASEAQREDASC